MAKRKKVNSSYSASVMESVGHEMKMNPPKILAHTRDKFGAKRAEKQRVAILLNKSRKKGVKIKRKRKK